MSFTYKVIAKGIHNSVFHEPNGKHTEVVVQEKFKKCPSWLKLVEKKAASKKGQPAKRKAKTTAPKAGKVQKKVKNVKDVVMNPTDEDVI